MDIVLEYSGDLSFKTSVEEFMQMRYQCTTVPISSRFPNPFPIRCYAAYPIMRYMYIISIPAFPLLKIEMYALNQNKGEISCWL